MLFLNELITRIFDLLLLPLQHINQWYGIITISVFIGFVMPLLYRSFSNQKTMKEVKGQISRYLLEIRIYKDDFKVAWDSIKNIFRFNLIYFKLSLLPAVILIIPAVFVMIQLNLRFGFKPLEMGEQTMVVLKLSEKISFDKTEIKLYSNDGIEIETPPLRMFDEKEVDWRIKADKSGKNELEIQINDQKFTKSVYIDDNIIKRLSPARVRNNVYEAFLNPGEKFIPQNSVVQSISVRYQKRVFDLMGWKTNWLVIFVALSMISGFF